MERPQDDLGNIVQRLLSTDSPDMQKEMVLKYFTEDASFSHPLCRVESAPNSRDDILNIYQFYRFLSPKIDVNIPSVAFDLENGTVSLDVSQQFYLRIWGWLHVGSVPCNMKIYLKLIKKNKLYYIASQEDFYHPDEFCKAVFPPLGPLVKTSLDLGRRATIKGNSLIQLFGYWRASDKKKDEHEGKDEESNKTDCPHSEDTGANDGGGWTEVKKKKTGSKKKHHQNPQTVQAYDTQSVEMDSHNGASSSA